MVPSLHKGWYETIVVTISSWPTGSSVFVSISSITDFPFETSLRSEQKDPRFWLGSAAGRV